MSEMTITEALAELRTIKKRKQKKQEALMSGPYLARSKAMKDPLEMDGGSAQFVESTLQAIRDLDTRYVKIRTMIQKRNLETVLTLGERTMTVAEWLNWRREIADGEAAWIRKLVGYLSQVRAQAKKEDYEVTSDPDGHNPKEIYVTVSERSLLEAAEKHEQITGELDGKLTLLNSKTMIEV